MLVWCVGRFRGELFRWEHDLVLVVVPFRLVINTSGQGIWLGQMLTGSMGEGVVELGQIEGTIRPDGNSASGLFGST